MDGALSLHFDAANQLRSWDVTDATGARTRVTLSDITQPASLDRNLFRLEDVLQQNRPGRR
jgi:outer membrane lipoprotein-sorting protein